MLWAAVTLVGCGGQSTNSPAGPTSPSGSAEDVNAILARCPTAAEVAASDRDLLLSFDYDVTVGRTVLHSGTEFARPDTAPGSNLSSAHNNAAPHVRRSAAVDVQFPVYVDGLGYPW